MFFESIVRITIIMKNINSIISIGAAFILGTGAGWIVKGKNIDYLFSHYLPAIATLLAAYFGAKFAFDFQRNKEKHDQKNKNRVSGNLAIFKLVAMLNSLLSYQKQIIEPVRTKPTAFLEMIPTLPQVQDHISIDIDSLSFLLDTNDENLIGELSVEVARYKAAIEAINDRSRVHRSEAQPTLAASDIKNGGDCSLEEIQNVLGERLFHTLDNSTNQVIHHVDSTILSLNDLAGKLSKSLKKQFPKERIISLLNPKDEENTN